MDIFFISIGPEFPEQQTRVGIKSFQKLLRLFFYCTSLFFLETEAQFPTSYSVTVTPQQFLFSASPKYSAEGIYHGRWIKTRVILSRTVVANAAMWELDMWMQCPTTCPRNCLVHCRHRQDSENGKMAMNPNHYPALRNIHSTVVLSLSSSNQKSSTKSDTYFRIALANPNHIWIEHTRAQWHRLWQ